MISVSKFRIWICYGLKPLEILKLGTGIFINVGEAFKLCFIMTFEKLSRNFKEFTSEIAIRHKHIK